MDKDKLTKKDIEKIVKDEVSKFLKEKELRKVIREIVSDSFDLFFKELWTKKGFWVNTIKNGK